MCYCFSSTNFIQDKLLRGVQVLLGSRFSIILQVTQLVDIWNFNLHFNSSDNGFLLTTVFLASICYPDENATNIIQHNYLPHVQFKWVAGTHAHNLFITLHTHMHNHRVRRIYYLWHNNGTISGTRILGARPVTNFD